MDARYDVVIIGGGFYGLYLADYLAGRFERVLLCERGGDFMQRASYHNQARVHNGYHYPRSLLTAVRSRVNFPRFIEEFWPAVDATFEKIYAIAARNSKVTQTQFVEFMRRIGAPIEPAAASIRKLFNAAEVDGVFRTEEHAFDAVKLKQLMVERVERAGIETRLQTTVARVRPEGEKVRLELAAPEGAETVLADHVFCCAYAQLNSPLDESGCAPIPLKHELTELALVEPPEPLRGLGVTVMDGPFFSCMPFPARQLHTLSHVRYTPHGHWLDGEGAYQPAYEVLDRAKKQSAFEAMVRDASRYLPVVRDCQYRESLWEVKTVLVRSEVDDSRPILFKPHYGLRNFHALMGGKIDNVYDVVAEIEQTFSWQRRGQYA